MINSVGIKKNTATRTVAGVMKPQASTVLRFVAHHEGPHTLIGETVGRVVAPPSPRVLTSSPGCVLMGQTARSAAYPVIGSQAVATRVPSISQRRGKRGTVAPPPSATFHPYPSLVFTVIG